MSLQYLTAAKLISAAEQGRSLKALCASMPKLRKVDYALAMQTLKFLPVLKQMFEQLGIDANSLDVQSGLMNVMVYEIVFGDGKISGGGAVKRKIMEHKDALIRIRDELMIGKTHYEELLSESMQEATSLPLYVRVNEALLTVDEGLEQLLTYDDTAAVDPLIPALIQLPPQCRGVSQDQMIKEGKLIIQDKASCFPAQILFHDFEQSGGTDLCDFVDACAAPGNKTSHLAALVHRHHGGKIGRSKVMAFDKSPRRAKIIKDRIKLFGLSNMVSVANQDFLAVDVNSSKYENVKYLLLDPSCSGSGIVRNIERVLDQAKEVVDEDSNDEEDKESNRLQNLQTFQINVIQKAMTFPSSRSIVYSTCSIHNEENEEVVAKVLASEEGQDWEVASPIGFDSWKRRGIKIDGITKDQAKMMIRCAPSDGTNGFFVTLFRKKSAAIGMKKSQPSKSAPGPLPTKKRALESKANNESENEDNEAEASNNQSKKGKVVKESQSSASAPPSKDQPNATKKEKVKKDTSNANTSLFGSRFKVSANKKRKFGKR